MNYLPKPHEGSRGWRTSKFVRTMGVLIVIGATAYFAVEAAASTRASRSTTVIHFVGEETPQTFAKVIAAFEKQNPSIQVKYQNVPFVQLNSVLQSRLSAHDPGIDVYMADEPRVTYLAHRGFLTDMSSLQSEIKAAMPKQALIEVTVGSKVYALPMWNSTQLLFYNKALLSKAGVAAPSASPQQRLTWEQVVTDAQAAQKAGAKWGVAFEQAPDYYELQPLAASLGGGPGLKGPGLLTPDLDSSAWVRAMTWYQGLVKSNTIPRLFDFGQIEQLFTTGQMAFIEGGPWDLGGFGAVKGLGWGYMPLPYFAGGKPATPTDSWALGISPFSQHQSQALAFAKFLTLNRTGSSLASQTIVIPPWNTFAYRAWLSRLRKQGMAGAATLIDYEISHTAIHRPTTVGYVAFETITTQAFTDILNGSPVIGRLKKADQQLKAAFKELPS